MARSRSSRADRFPVLSVVVVLVAAGCPDERPPRPSPSPAASAETAAEPVFLQPQQDTAVLTYAADRGRFVDTSQVDGVPVDARGLVRVSLPGRATPPPGRVFVANLRQPEADGTYRLETVPRDQFEELALGQGRRSRVDLPDGLEPPPEVPTTGEIVVYKTDWCGVCKQVMRYFDRKKVAYVAKDVEKDKRAAAELAAKAQAQGVPLGSVPIIDVRGELMVGFDRKRLERLL
ncbi:MAG: hypothetical protein B7733_04045 [Myxococcales bacterium FL481]|nr:MAG: hypothetical protein B7733_04045 [Myxococcales bacterium FL481]